MNNRAFTHVCQKGKGGNVLFYCLYDRLVYYTLFCTEAKRLGVRPIALSLMFTHTHSLLSSCSPAMLRRFISVVENRYAKAFNSQAGLKGSLFLHPFAWSKKWRDKDIRSCCIYIGNNSVEKQLFPRAEEDRWSFVAYAGHVFPFSKSVPLRLASTAYRKSLRLAKSYQKKGKHLNYSILKTIFSPLSDEEKERMTDDIIQMYNVLDYDSVLRHFGSHEAFLHTLHSTSGSDYDIKEEWIRESDIAYRKLCQILGKMGYDLVGKRFLSEPLPDEVLRALVRESRATSYQLKRFLHLEPRGD